MKLLQINFVEKLTKNQKALLKKELPYHEIKKNKRVYCKRMNKHFDTKKELNQYKKELSNLINTPETSILFTFQGCKPDNLKND